MREKDEGQGRTEDMIQMALRMAEEMTGPMEDLEAAVQPTTAVSTLCVPPAPVMEHFARA